MRFLGSKSPPTWTPPTVPVSAKCGAFWIGDDLVSDSTWAPRVDNISAGSITGTNTVRNASGWVTPEGNRKTWTFNGTNALARCNGLVSMATADDPPLEVVMWYRVVSTNATNVLFGWSSTSSATPKRILLFTTGPYRWTQQATTSVFGHNATNLLQQMVRVRMTNNGAGTDTTIWRNEELDPIDADGTLQMNVAAQAVNTFVIGAQDNGGSIVNFANIEVFAIWVRNPASAPLTDDEGIELHNFVMGGFDQAPYYRGSEVFFLPWHAGQSNSFANGLGTGSVAGLPDTLVQQYLWSGNNTAQEPTGLSALDIRGGVNHGPQHYIQHGSFAMRHHQAGVGKGATNAGTNWGGGSGSGPANSLQGYYSTDLPSLCRRNIFMTRARFGGNPIVHCTWWQGENDAAAGSVVAGQYAANLGAIKGYIRAFWARMGQANVPFHIMKLNPAQTGGGIVLADLNTINAGIDTVVAGDPYARSMTWSDLTGATYIQGDNLHGTPAAYAIAASRFIASAKSMDSRL